MAELNVINNIPQTTYRVEGDDFSGYRIYVTPLNGAKIVISPAPTYTYSEYGEMNTYDFDNLSEDEVSNVWEFLPDPPYAPVTLNGQTTGGIPQPTVNVTNNIADTTEAHTFDGQTCVINITGEYRGYSYFDAKASYTGADGSTPKEKPLTVNGDNASVTITDADFDAGITITGEYVQAIEIENTLTNCTVSGLQPKYKPSDTLQITITANKGCSFSKTENSPKLHVIAFLGEQDIPFTFEDGATTATLEQALQPLANEGYETYTLTGGAVESTPIAQSYGAINVYVVTTDALDAFANDRFAETEDRGNYVNRLKRIFANVPTAGQTTIQLGNEQTTIQAQSPAQTRLTLDFGDVEIPAPNGDATDYESEVQLFIPFHGFVSIPADYAGQEVNLTCVLDIVTGEGVALLTAGGVTFAAYDIEPSQDVLYRTVAQQVNTIGGDSWSNKVLYGLEPYLSVKWYASKQAGRGATFLRAKIGDLSGFNVLDDITIISAEDMLAEEQKSIYTALQNGVYVE
jgi:hypothetical protein